MNAFQVFLALLLLFPFTLLKASPNISFVTSDKRVGFSLKLIHKYSPESPTYPGKNLTFSELIDRYYQDSRSRASYLMSKISSEKPSHDHLLTPYVYNYGFGYYVQVRIGIPGSYFYLLFDTGSNVNWVLCKPERDVLKHEIYFNPYLSKSYRNVTCKEQGCKSCDSEGHCSYEVHYGDGSVASGVLARDKFHFMAHGDLYVTFKNILFGCSNPATSHETVATNLKGILGMSSSHDSMAAQLMHYTGGRFSYCLVPPREDDLTPRSLLRFGSDVKIKSSSMHKTQILKNPGDKGLYYLDLKDISVNGKLLRYPRGSFNVYGKGKSGLLIDSGTAISWLRGDAYWMLHNAVVQYFTGSRLVRLRTCRNSEVGRSGIQLCYLLPHDWNRIKYPSITLHLQNADYEIEPMQAFIIDHKRTELILAFALSPKSNILGAWQQHNKHIVYDNLRAKLWFGDETCADELGD